MTHALDDTIKVLRFIRPETTGMATHWITSHLGYGKDHARTRRLLKRMAAADLVEPVPYAHSGLVYHYKLTETGKARRAEYEASEKTG